MPKIADPMKIAAAEKNKLERELICPTNIPNVRYTTH